MTEGPQPPPPETVQAHVERTMHALLDRISDEMKTIGMATESAARIEKLAQAFASLSCWPKEYMTPEQHRQLAEYEVEKALDRRAAKP